MAAFLHDIAKGRDEDHSIVGARIARELCPRLGLSAAETETVAWLIEQHLLMSPIAFSRDIGDPKTIRDFANIVQSPERLKLLLVLTVADIRAVGPGVWNGWKGQLLRALYYETEPLVAGGHTQLGRARPRRPRPRTPSAPRSPTGRRRRSSASSSGTIPTTGCRTETRKVVEHAKLDPRRRAGGRAARQRLHDRRLHGHHRAVAVRAQPSAPAGAVRRRLRRRRRQHLGRAHLTTRDGFALDTFLLARDFEQDEDELRRARRIAETIEQGC